MLPLDNFCLASKNVATYMIRMLLPLSREVLWLGTHAAVKKSFANSHKTSKFTKVFSLESFLLYSISTHMWQSWIEIEYYSVAYFERITKFDVP